MEAEERPRKIQKTERNGVDAASNSASGPIESNKHEEEGLTSNERSVKVTGEGPPVAGEKQLSKNQLKKIRKQEEWEAGRDFRKAKRKEKLLQKRQRDRAARQNGHESKLDQEAPGNAAEQQQSKPKQPHHQRSTQLPISFVFDCGFDELMTDKERISLAAQLTRSYSDNHKAPLKAHLIMSSFNGKLRERFEGPLMSHHQSWRGVRFLEEDFVEAVQQASQLMKGNGGGKLAGALKEPGENEDTREHAHSEEGEVIYLTSDSPDTLSQLKPYSTYIIGALVDKNRHKGICYKRALDSGVKTAKLPIGDYMQMSSRFVLATNHVSEIMLRWLEIGDWGEAFVKVVPKRKGGILKSKEMTGPEATDTDVSSEVASRPE